VRDAFPPNHIPPNDIPPNRFFDPSPITISLSFDWHVWDSLRGGRLPLWERLQGGGYSPVVALQGGVLHPVRWLATLAPRELMPSVLIVLSLTIGITGWVLYGFWAGLRPVSIAVGTLLFAFSPQIVSFVHYSGALLSLAHLPWVVLLTRRAGAEWTRRRFVALAVAFGSLLMAGHPLMEMTVCIAAGTFALADAIATRRLRPIVVVLGAAACGTLLALATLLPAIVAWPEMWSYKTTQHGRSYMPWPLSSWARMAWQAMADQWTGGCCFDLPAFWSYIGMPVIILVLALVRVVRKSREAMLLVLLSLLWFLVIIPGPWMRVLHGLPLLSYPKDWYYSGSFAFVFSAAAAYGFDQLWRSSRRARWIAAALAMAAIGTYAVRSVPVFAPRRWTPMVAGSVVENLRSKKEHFRMTATQGQVHVPNTARLTGIEDVRLSGPYFSRRFRAWWLLVDPGVDRRSFPTTPMTDVLDSPLVDDFNVAYVVQSRWKPTGWFHSATRGLRDTTLSRRLVEPAFPLVARTRSLEVRFNRGCGPRAHFAERVVAAKDLGDAFRTLKRDPQLPRRASVIEATVLPALPAAARGRVAVHYPDDAHVVLQSESDTGGLVVLHDSYAPGWTARVDGAETPIYPVNVLSRGVVVPAGRHRVTMAYIPPGLIPGAAIALLTLAGLLLFAAAPQKHGGDRDAEGQEGDRDPDIDRRVVVGEADLVDAGRHRDDDKIG